MPTSAKVTSFGQVTARVRRVDQGLGRARGGLPRRGDLGLLEVEHVQHLRDDRRDPQLERRAEVVGQGLERVVVLLGRPLGDLTGLIKGVEHDPAQQRGPVGEAAVERRDPDPGPLGDLVQRDPGALLGDQVAGRGEQLLEVPTGVGAHGHRLTLAKRRKFLHIS